MFACGLKPLAHHVIPPFVLVLLLPSPPPLIGQKAMFCWTTGLTWPRIASGSLLCPKISIAFVPAHPKNKDLVNSRRGPIRTKAIEPKRAFPHPSGRARNPITMTEEVTESVALGSHGALMWHFVSIKLQIKFVRLAPANWVPQVLASWARISVTKVD